MKFTNARHDFGPVINSESKILILGSFPSVKSRQVGFFYMYPQNRFWKILSSLFQADFESADIDVKTDLLHRHGIALYDVIESCDISGSKDATIVNVIPANIQKLMASSQITRIFLNGNKAFSLFKRYHPEYVSLARYLPSSSPANATNSLEKLITAWKIIVKSATVE